MSARTLTFVAARALEAQLRITEEAHLAALDLESGEAANRAIAAQRAADRRFSATAQEREAAANHFARVLGPDVEAPAERWHVSVDSTDLATFALDGLEFGVWGLARSGRGGTGLILGVRRRAAGPETTFHHVPTLAALGAWLALHPEVPAEANQPAEQLEANQPAEANDVLRDPLFALSRGAE